MTVNIEDFIGSALTYLVNHECYMLLEDTAVTMFVSLTKIVSRQGLP